MEQDITKFFAEFREIHIVLFVFPSLLNKLNIISRQLGSEAYILSVFSDGERNLIRRDRHARFLVLLVEHHFLEFGGRERLCYEVHRFFRPVDHVDVLVVQFPDDRVNTYPLHADTRAHSIDPVVMGEDGDFCTIARLPCNGLDLNDAVINFGDLDLEQTHQEVRVRS